MKTSSPKLEWQCPIRWHSNDAVTMQQGTCNVRRQTGCPAVSYEVHGPWEAYDHGGCLDGPADSCGIGPRSSSPGTGRGRLGRCRPGSKRRLDHRWRPGSMQRHGHRQRPDHRWRFGHRWRPGHRGRLGHRWRPGHSGRPGHSWWHGQWQPSRCLDSGVISKLRLTFWWSGRVGWSSTSSSSGSGQIGRAGESGSHASGWTRRFQLDGDQHSSLPCRRPSISQHWWTLSRCGRCFNAAWISLVSKITPAVRLSRHHYLLPDMTQPTGDQSRWLDLQKEDPSLQRGSSIRLRVPSVLSSDGPRRPRDRLGLTWDHAPRTPVRRARNQSESRDSRSRSPLSRSSSVESTAWDESPLNFNAALDVDSKRAISEDEDAEGDSKKISAAQYEIFRQAVTTSKGTYKVNPAKTKRAARASLLDLGDTEVPDRVSWLDQPSLQDTMASTARIAQGLKEDKEVVKTTLSETLNDNTSSFKFFTVKQIFPREPYPLKIHRDALYVPKPPGDHGFIDNKTPSSYHLSHRVCLDTEELARRSAIYASLADSMVASVI